MATTLSTEAVAMTVSMAARATISLLAAPGLIIYGVEAEITHIL